MANLIVTFTRVANSGGPYGSYSAPVEIGDEARTEQIAIAGASAPGALTRTGAEDIVSLYALAACWISIGATPVAAAGTGRYMAAGERLQFAVSGSDKVAVITG